MFCPRWLFKGHMTDSIPKIDTIDHLALEEREMTPQKKRIQNIEEFLSCNFFEYSILRFLFV